MSSLSTMYFTNGLSTWVLISGALALIGAAAAAYYFLRPQSRARYTGMMKRIQSHVNFDRLIFPLVLKFLYVFSALYAVFSGIVTLVTVNVWTGILMIVLGPLCVRIAYELILTLFSVYDGIKETNRLLRAGTASRSGAPQPHPRPMHPAQGNDELQPDQPKHYPGGYDPLHKS